MKVRSNARNKMLSVGAGAILGFILVTGSVLAQNFICDSQLATLISDVLTIVMYGAGMLAILRIGSEKLAESAGADKYMNDSGEGVGKFVKAYVGAILAIYGLQLFILAFTGFDLSCIVPDFPPDLNALQGA